MATTGWITNSGSGSNTASQANFVYSLSNGSITVSQFYGRNNTTSYSTYNGYGQTAKIQILSSKTATSSLASSSTYLEGVYFYANSVSTTHDAPNPNLVYSYPAGRTVYLKLTFSGSGTSNINNSIFISDAITMPANSSYIWYEPNGGTLSSDSYDLYDGTIRRLSDLTKYFDPITYGTSDDPYNAATFGLTRTGYTFSGYWNSNSSGTGTNFHQSTNYSGQTYKTDLGTVDGGKVSLYAKWTINTYTVSFNANGGSGAPSSQTKTYGVSLTLSSTKPTRTGYTFSSWNTNSSGTGTSYSSGGSYTANAGTTLYAQWTANATSISNVSATVEKSTTITLSPSSTSLTHTITYSFGSLSGTIATKTSSTSISWTVPSTFYAQMPDTTSKTGTISCQTYLGTTSLGTKSSTLTISTDGTLCSPTLSFTVIDNNSTTTNLTGDNGVIILGQSTAYFTITKSVVNSSTFKTMTINGTSIGNVSTYTLSKASTGTFVIILTDSRGYTKSVTVTKTTVSYSTPSLSFVPNRKIPVVDDIINITFSGSWNNIDFGAVENSLTAYWQYQEKDAEDWSDNIPITIDDGSLNMTITSDAIFDYKKEYYVRLTYYDELSGTQTITQLVLVGISLMDYYKDKVKFNVPIDIENMLVAQSNQYMIDDNYGLFMNNSDITGANGIYFGDLTETGEGLNFPKTSADGGSTDIDDYDTLNGYGGILYYNGNTVFDANNCTISKSETGYTKFANGLIIQWGKIIVTSTTLSTVVLPVSFTGMYNYQVVATKYWGSGQDGYAYYSDRSASQFNIGMRENSNSNDISWIAIGY